ncbi:neutral zinc metallopeptidase [Planomonospora sp. ID82291]|nr:neutral zinc metallopeptidase [Planomonospora sp. ID82291]
MPYGQPPPPAPHHRPPAYPPPAWQPARPRGGGAGVVIGTVFGLLALVFTGLVLAGAVIKSSRDSASVPSVAIPTFTPNERSTGRPGDGRSDEPEPRTSRPSAEPSETSTPRRTLNTSLKNNSLYSPRGLPRVHCPAGSGSIYNHSQLKSLILKTSRCMDKVWSKVLKDQGIAWHRPGYAVASRRGRGACGDFPQTGSIVPYYCPRNTTIYASTAAMAKGSGNSLGYGQITDWHGAIISMMAHEYGHHVQQLSGLSNTWWQQTLESGSRSGKLALSRRFELQATCFGGMFMRAAAASYPVTPARRNTLYYFYSRVGDHPGWPRDHGSPANNNRWFRQGYEKNKTFQCNTWLAPSSTTS